MIYSSKSDTGSFIYFGFNLRTFGFERLSVCKNKIAPALRYEELVSGNKYQYKSYKQFAFLVLQLNLSVKTCQFGY